MFFSHSILKGSTFKSYLAKTKHDDEEPLVSKHNLQIISSTLGQSAVII